MMYDMMVHGGGWPAAWPWLALWILLKLTVWALVITGLVFGVRWLRRETCRRPLATPLEILKTRYAKGELSREEFDSMKRELGPGTITA
jgi:putative membrane protein